MKMMGFRLRNFAWFFALTAIMLRVALPVGWMPVTDAVGGTSLVICTGHGPLVAPAHSRRQAPLPGRSSDICPFAALVNLSPPAPFALLPAPVLNSGKTSPAVYGQVVSLTRPSHGNHAPRAPPNFA
jgi:hypothetical protein